MISAKKLLKLARKWQKMAAIKRKRITMPQTVGNIDACSCSILSMSEKGHFVVYSADQRRFALPLEYLNNKIIQELLNMAEEEFGLQIKGGLTLPCDAELMEYIIALIKRHVTTDVERALLMSISSSCCLSSMHLQHPETINQMPICIF